VRRSPVRAGRLPSGAPAGKAVGASLAPRRPGVPRRELALRQPIRVTCRRRPAPRPPVRLAVARYLPALRRAPEDTPALFVNVLA